MSLKTYITQHGMTLKMECHSKWNFSQNGISLKNNVTQNEISLKFAGHSKLSVT